MKQSILKIKSISVGLCLASLYACSLNIPPQDQFSDPDAITNVTNARSLLASAYSSFPHYEYEFSLLGNDFVPTSLSVTTQVGLSYSPMHNFPRCNQRE